MIFAADFRGRNSGGPVLPGRVVAVPSGNPDATELTLSLYPRVVYLVHGFNVDRAAGQAKLRALGDHITTQLAGAGAETAFVAVTWPGDSWAGPASYSLEGNDADDTAAELARFIDRVHPGGTQLSFVSHSLGARVVFETLKRLEHGRYPVPQVCVMAAAIDDFSVSAQPIYRPQVATAGRVAVLASASDPVLRLAYPLGDLLQSFLFFWKDVDGLALGYHGPRPAGGDAVPGNVLHEQIPATNGVGHGDYLFVGEPNGKQARAAAFVGAVIAGAESPLY